MSDQRTGRARVPERIYAGLLRLYPSRFREAYGEAALQLFRDRSRHERGFVASLRLWSDLLVDFVVSVPREYWNFQPALAAASAQARSDGIPSFHVFERESPARGALLAGGVLSLVVVVSCSLAFVASGKYRPFHFSVAYAARDLMPPSATPSKPQDDNPVANQAAGGNLDPGAAYRRRVVDGAIAILKRYYVDPVVAQKMADALLAHEQRGDYDAMTDGAAFAALLTRQLRDVSQDMHLEVVYSKTPLPERSTGPAPERVALYRKAMEEHNCTFEKVETLPHNIGYMKLNSFPDPSLCQPTATAAMASLNHADVIIFDLRDNGGGYPNMVMLIAAYLFDHPEYMYNPRENTSERSWTRSPVPGNQLADKPVYVLTSGRTFSGAEHFSYDLKMLKRATLVGETTRGATDVGVFHRIDDHFGMGIRETRAINPYSEPDWAATGVEPDVKVPAADALATAERLAESRLRKEVRAVTTSTPPSVPAALR
jgi:hypothetical protein